MTLSAKQHWFLREPLPRMTIIQGPISCGKTFIGNNKSIEHIVNNYKNEGLIFFVGRTLNALENNVLLPLEKFYRGYFKYSLNQKKAIFCGIRIELEGCNDITAETKIRGSTAEYIYGDELTLWNKPFLVRCMGSLRTTNACFLGTTNPDSPFNFVMQDYLMRKEILGLRDIKFEMEDNPNLTEEYKRQINLEYTGIFHDRFIKGLWVMAEGLIYSNFNKKRHIVETKERQYEEYYITIDYGTQNPFAMILFGRINITWYAIKEYYYDGRKNNKQKTDEQYYKDLVDFAGNLNIEQIIIDPSASSMIACIRSYGQFSVKKAVNDVIDGIRDVCTALEVGLLLINDCCKYIEMEMNTYAWDEKAKGDKPLKISDHAMDAIRYLFFTLRIVRNWRNEQVA